ncbi:MAG TPA: hypothetical protein VMV28_02320 [Thermoplasmata archaeon]|nr:hypothetical protein [Thermoplasmata archaeon]
MAASPAARMVIGGEWVDLLAHYTVLRNIGADFAGPVRKGWHYTVYGDP